MVVGASKGIGNSLAKMLTADGNTVIAISRTEGELAGMEGVDFQTYDVASDEPLPTIEGIIDGVVYCPGSINLRPFNRLTETDFVSDMQINLLGAVRVIQHYLPNLKISENGSIVLFSTVAVQTGMGFHASVSAAKGAVEGLTRALAAEFAPKIRVNCIAPSLTDTPLAEKLLNTPEKRDASAKEGWNSSGHRGNGSFSAIRKECLDNRSDLTRRRRNGIRTLTLNIRHPESTTAISDLLEA